MKSSISKYWSAGLWKYLRPKDLVVGIVDCCRLAWNSIFDLENKITDNIPVACGDNYEIIAVPLSDIDNTRNIVGIGSDLAEEFPYTLLNAPPDIVRFSNAVSSVGAVLYFDFITSTGRYYFKEHPSKFGVVNTKDGSRCTFIVSRTSKVTSNNANYAGCGNYGINHTVNAQLKQQESANGGSSTLILQAAGVDVAKQDTTISKVWQEGRVWFCRTASGEILRDTQAVNAPELGAEIKRGNPITNSVFTKELVYPDSNGVLVPVGADSVVNLKYYPQLCKLLKLPVGDYEVSKDTISELLRSLGYVSVCTNGGPDEAQHLVKLRTLLPSTLTLLQSTKVICSTELEEDKTYVLYSFFTKSDKSYPFIYPDITAREAALNNADTCSIVRSTLRITGDKKVSALITQGDIWGGSPTTGMYLSGILLAVSTDGYYSNDTIKEYIALQPLRLHAGACVIAHLGN